MVLIVIVVIMIAVAVMKPKEETEGVATVATDKKATVGLPSESYNEYDVPKKGPQEINAENLYKRGMREYNNANYIRAMQYFQQSLTEDPTSLRAQASLKDAEIQLTNDIKKRLLEIPAIDIEIDGKKSPLMVGLQRTTASLASCFEGKTKKIIYPIFC